jgi:hypothetical protein
MGDMADEYNISFHKHEGNNHTEDLGINGRIILQPEIKKEYVRVWIGFVWLRRVS